MQCSLCEQFEERNNYLHTWIKGLIVCICCYDDMNKETRASFHKFVADLLRQVPDKSDIKIFPVIYRED